LPRTRKRVKQLETKITERLVSRLWQSHPVIYPVADTGQWLHIIFPGRTSLNSGCDFKDAVFGLNGSIVSGDVEVHVKSSQWQGHGHHQDPKYNNIALHVVWQQDSQTATRLQNGKVIPTICLSSVVKGPLDELLNMPADSLSFCPAVRMHSDSAALEALLTAAGVKRFKMKTSSFRKALKNQDGGQVLYRGLARALGYIQNAEPCQELAERLPLSELTEDGTVTSLQARLLGHAGLLPTQRHKQVKDSEARRLEKIWRSVGTVETMKATDWCFYRVRPDNFPTRRLIALSYLLNRYCKAGLSHSTVELVKTAPEHNAYCWLESRLAVEARGYWQHHFDFSVSTGRTSALIGCEKSSAIILNTVLPFAAAFADLAADSKLKMKILEIYRGYPPRADNELTRYMKQQLKVRPGLRLPALQQQGLIHLFRGYCRHRDCLACPAYPSPG
jgi:Protein of unknown function (DUF2851)